MPSFLPPIRYTRKSDLANHRSPRKLGTPLTRISHELAYATADASYPTAFRSVGLLDVLHEYNCGGLGRKPCQSGASTVSLRKLMNLDMSIAVESSVNP